MKEYCCKHCPADCTAQHDAPPEIDCADCCVQFEMYIDTLPT